MYDKRKVNKEKQSEKYNRSLYSILKASSETECGQTISIKIPEQIIKRSPIVLKIFKLKRLK